MDETTTLDEFGIDLGMEGADEEIQQTSECSLENPEYCESCQ